MFDRTHKRKDVCNKSTKSLEQELQATQVNWLEHGLELNNITIRYNPLSFWFRQRDVAAWSATETNYELHRGNRIYSEIVSVKLRNCETASFRVESKNLRFGPVSNERTYFPVTIETRRAFLCPSLRFIKHKPTIIPYFRYFDYPNYFLEPYRIKRYSDGW